MSARATLTTTRHKVWSRLFCICGIHQRPQNLPPQHTCRNPKGINNSKSYTDKSKSAHPLGRGENQYLPGRIYPCIGPPTISIVTKSLESAVAWIANPSLKEQPEKVPTAIRTAFERCCVTMQKHWNRLQKKIQINAILNAIPLSCVVRKLYLRSYGILSHMVCERLQEGCPIHCTI